MPALAAHTATAITPSPSPDQREAAMQQYPFNRSERHELATARVTDDITWVEERYGEKIAALLSFELFGNADTEDDIQRSSLYARKGMKALGIPDCTIVLPQDIQTGILLAQGRSQSMQVLAGVRQHLQKGINSLQIHRSGVSGVEENPTTVYLPSHLQIDDAMQTYMTSVPQVSPRNGEGESQMQHRLAQERKNAFALYRDLLEAEQMQGLHDADLQNILEVCFRLCNGQQPSFVLTTGFGGSEDQPSTRMPSYIAGSCEVMKIFLKHRDAGTIRSMPIFRILNAFQVAGIVNHMDKSRIQSAAQDMQRVLRAFVDRFLPDIAKYVSFETDEEIVYPTLQESQEYFAHLSADHPGQQKIVAQAERMMQKERLKNRDDAVHRVQQYIAAHIALFLDVIDPEWHGDTSYFEEKPDIVWSIGGKGEQFFNEFRRMLSADPNGPDHFHSSYHPLSIRTLQKSGQHPPYYHLPEVDTSIYQLNGQPIVPDFKVIKNKAISKSIRPDYQALLIMVKEATASDRGTSVQHITDSEADSLLKSFFQRIGHPDCITQ